MMPLRQSEQDFWKPVSNQAWWFAAIALGLVCASPLLVTDVPPVLDYPNHLARMVVLAFAGSDPILRHIYQAHWRIIPNLAIDLVAPQLLSFLPVSVVGRIMLAASLLLPSLGVLVYSRVLFRENLIWPFASALIASNLLFLLGFMNFLISIGIALVVGAAWTAWRDRFVWRCTVSCSIGAVLVFFCHIAGLLFLGVLIGSAEIERLSHHHGGRNLVATLKSLLPLSAVALPSLLLYSVSPFSSASAPSYHGTVVWKLVGLFSPVIGYNLAFSICAGCTVLLFVVICMLNRCWDAPLRSRIGLAMLLLAYAMAPFAAKGGAWIDVRFSVMAGFLLFAGFTPRRLSPRAAMATTMAFALMILINTFVVVSNWTQSRVDLRELRAAISSVQPGTRVLVVSVRPSTNPAYWDGEARRRRLLGITNEFHMAALLLIEHHAFWPLLFSVPSQQPVQVLPPYRDLSAEAGVPPDYHTLFETGIPTDGLQHLVYMSHWRDHFDAILVLDAGGIPELRQPLPAGLTLATNTGFAALIRINHVR